MRQKTKKKAEKLPTIDVREGYLWTCPRCHDENVIMRYRIVDEAECFCGQKVRLTQ